MFRSRLPKKDSFFSALPISVWTGKEKTEKAPRGRASSARTDEKLYVSTNGSTWVPVSSANFTTTNYYFFKVACETSSSSYSNFNLSIGLPGQDNTTNVANYIMYEDTNGQCVTKLNSAINKLNSMSSSSKTTFWTSNDYVIQRARERLSAWAAHEGKTLTFNNGIYVLSSNSRTLFAEVSNDSTMLIIMTISLISITLLGGYFFIKRKKQQ